MNDKTIDLEQVRAAYTALPQTFSSVLMATVSGSGEPEASYAAYIRHDGQYYVYVSELATHTRNLLANGRVCLLFVEDEDKAAHLFARQRVTYHCSAGEIDRDSEAFAYIMVLFEEKFGAFMKQLQNMQDFHLFCLSPQRGSFVQGFAKAFAIEGDDLAQIRHVNDVGHQTREPAESPA
ncbi:pyridoxamine 5'-phosphate oxidase-like FMN-binding protein [Methylomonas albis]|uniref:Pyridoxamine 5'-phosphate oxidase family protein n=1 Tax=Methylomonas albis TaxID=1854563 RepID=A0ABR9D1Y6_9GAMM|nr:pyridoxamine 5'-phosphate oxidase family protein [Methylomonas albis]MBD9357134.1 pyridoxamine 5'-phosphate oxidase family protein [Methylomonas albis]CAD6880354.1 pyridoxamine 5'-phosphate oxidase-like FMN-binding protein [Methylomonas albis]